MLSGFSDIVPFETNFRPGWLGDFLTRDHLLPGGIKLDAATFLSADAQSIVVGSAGAAGGATTVPVDALPVALKAGTILDFGARAAQIVTAGAASADATTLPVTALAAPIPNGTVLDFGAKKFARLTAAAPAGATSLTVSALVTALAGAETATIPAVSGRTAELTADAAEAATSLTVKALPEPLYDDDTASYIPFQEENGVVTQVRRVAAGTLVGLTFTELDAAGTDGVLWGKAVDGDDVVRILAFDVQDVLDNNDGDILRPGTLIKVNYLPNWSTLSSTLKGKIRVAYDVTVGTPGQEVAAA